MSGQGHLFKIINAFGSYRNILNNRPNICYQQAATMKHSTKEKLKEMNFPEKPKKPLTPYFRFLADHRADIVRKEPSLKLTDIAKQCAADWSQLNSVIKEKYANGYKTEMEEYTKTNLEYTAKLTEEQKEALKNARVEKKVDKKKRETKKLLRELEKPKRPIGSYMQFLLELARKENKKLPDVLAASKGLWQDMPESDKARYTAHYVEDKKRYDAEMEIWEAKMIKEGHSDLVRKTTLVDTKPSRLRKKITDRKE